MGILIGGMIGAGSTVLADVARWRRQRSETDRATRREVYSRFLESLTSTDSELQLLAIENQTPVPEAVTREVWRRNSVLSLSYEVQLIAPGPVVHASINAYMRLRALFALVLHLASPTSVASPLRPVRTTASSWPGASDVRWARNASSQRSRINSPREIVRRSTADAPCISAFRRAEAWQHEC